MESSKAQSRIGGGGKLGWQHMKTSGTWILYFALFTYGYDQMSFTSSIICTLHIPNYIILGLDYFIFTTIVMLLS
jgi:hypothetical protein